MPPIPPNNWRSLSVGCASVTQLYTSKHGSWLNIAENELSSLTRQCVAGRRFGDAQTLRRETGDWSSNINSTQRGVDWQMKIDDARCKLTSVYPKIKM
jgi:hypothetical protein